MFSSEPPPEPKQPLVQTLLEPLLNDFQHWFSESKTLLTSPKADTVETAMREDLLQQIDTAQQEVVTAKMLLMTTDGQAGVETSMVMGWHQLVMRCWQVARQIRQNSQPT